MKPPNGAARVAVLRPKTGRVTLVPEHALALIGCAVVARSVVEHAQRGGGAVWSGALGALVAVIALSTLLRLTRWQPWAQAVAGCGLFIAPLMPAIASPDWISLGAGTAVAVLAVIEIDAVEMADRYARHRGWRRPAPRSGRGLRLVYSRNPER
jgi:membrane protein YdbS with pleckstrin-like domain